jgi:hypothetical protein
MTFRFLADRLLVAVTAGALLAALPVHAQPATQSTVVQGVTVKVTPKNVAPDAATWSFAVVLDTHSQELADDPARTTVLLTDDGRRLAPTSWQGPGAGGHHREGTLEFAAPKPPPKSVELKMQRPGEAEPRSYRWTF